MKTLKTYVGEAGRTVYPVDFTLGYLDKSHVYVYTGNVPTDQLAYTWPNKNQIELVEPLEEGVTFSIQRITPRQSIFNDYENGAILEERNLDDSFKQTLMVLEEYTDGFITADDILNMSSGLSLTGLLNMLGNRLINLGDATNETDAVNLRQLRDATAFKLGINIISETIPSEAAVDSGARWYKPSEAVTYVYYCDGTSCQWVQEPVAATFLQPVKTIVSSTSAGIQGQFCFDNDYAYCCVAENLWKRLPLASW